MVFTDDQRAALRLLADASRKKKIQHELAPLVTRDVRKLLSIRDDKARKTASVLLGLCAPDACAAELKNALMRETIRFVRPSMILALGNTANPSIYLNGYVVEAGEDKHMREEREALQKALAKTQQARPTGKLSLPQWCDVTYVHRGALMAELREKKCDFRETSGASHTVAVKSADLGRIRCAVDALYELGGMGKYSQAAKTLDDMGCRGLYYRIEAGAYRPEARRGIIRAISEGLAPLGYRDNPSAYSFEIRVLDDRMFAVFLGDERFSYRKQAVPASIHPVTAASVMQICKPYMRSGADVLDPFCGSGTMLIERGIVASVHKLVGVDISPLAIKAACANRKASGQNIALIRGDILGYGAAKYDEIISNMPFGNRVSNHASNTALYTRFADKLSSLLKDGGMAFLYTQEKKLLRSVILAASGLEIIQEAHFSSGGLYPTLFIVKKDGKYE
jgi:predicted RNA methylase